MTTQTQHAERFSDDNIPDVCEKTAGPDERSQLRASLVRVTQLLKDRDTLGASLALADVEKLIDALLADSKGGEVVALRQENELLRTALRFYANGDHYHLDASEEFDTVSGEPQSWLCSGVEDSETMVENGEVARYTLMGQVIGWEDAEEDHTPQPIEGEAPFFAAALFTAYNTHPQQQAAPDNEKGKSNGRHDEQRPALDAGIPLGVHADDAVAGVEVPSLTDMLWKSEEVMSLTTEQAAILANIAIDEYVAACRADNEKQKVHFLSTMYVLVAQRTKDAGGVDVQLAIDSNPARPEQQRIVAGSMALGQPVGQGQNALPSDSQAQGIKHVAEVVGVDEYGPMLEWSTHWVELVGAKLYIHPQQQAAQAAVPQGLVLVQGYERLIDQYIEEYEFTDGDSGYHDPSEFEQAMIKDAFMGFDFSSLFCAVPAPVEQKGKA